MDIHQSNYNKIDFKYKISRVKHCDKALKGEGNENSWNEIATFDGFLT